MEHRGLTTRAGGAGSIQPETVRIWLLGGFRISVGPRTIEADRWRLRKAAALINLLSDTASPEVTNTAGTSTINWPNNIIFFVRTDNDGNDTITGNSATNIINTWAGGGSDSVSTRGGDDYIDVRDGIGNDTVDCGEDISAFDWDNDEVHYDTGDVLVTPSHCESKHLD